MYLILETSIQQIYQTKAVTHMLSSEEIIQIVHNMDTEEKVCPAWEKVFADVANMKPEEKESLEYLFDDICLHRFNKRAKSIMEQYQLTNQE